MTNRILINGIEAASHTVSGVITVRIESDAQMQNCMLFIGGLDAAEALWWGGDGPVVPTTRFGLTAIRLNHPTRTICEFDIDSSYFEDQRTPVWASLWEYLIPTNLIAEVFTNIKFANAGAPVTATLRPRIPHFAKDGEILYQYDPVRSIIPNMMFAANPPEFTDSGRPNLLTEYKASFNCLFAGVAINHVRDNPSCTQAEFEAAQIARIDPIVDLCNEHGLICLADQMDWAATDAYVTQIMDKSWAFDAVKNTYEYMKASGVFCGADLCDETTAWWNASQMINMRRLTEPTVVTGAFTTTRVGVPQAWTTLGMYSELGTYRNKQWYEGQYWNDYLSLGCGLTDWRYGRNPTEIFGGLTVDQSYRGMLGSFADRRTDCPTITNTTCCGQFLLPQHSLAMTGFGIVLGAVGIKSFTLKTAAYEAIGVYGCDPDTFPLLWQGMKHANLAVAELTPLILQPRVKCESAGRFFATGEWKGEQGNLFLAVNRLDTMAKATIPTGYGEGYTLWLNGKRSISVRSGRPIVVGPGGWVVCTG